MNNSGGFRSSVQRRPADPGKIEKARDPRNALMRLLPYLYPFKVILILVLVFVLIYTVLGLMGPYLMGVAIDKFISTKDTAGLVNIAIWMFVTYLLNNLFQAISAWMMSDVSQRALKQVRKDLFSHLQSLPISFFDSNPAGDLMSRLTNDIDAINQAVSQNIVSLLASVLSLAGILIAMFVLDKWLALASVLVVPIMFWFTQFVAKYTRRGFRDLQKHLGELNGVMEETISGQKVVKAFRRNESAIALFRQHNEEVFRAGVSANSYALLLMPLTNVLGNFFVIVLVGLGGWLALQGLVTVGIIATFITYGQNFIQPLRQLANMYNSIQAALAGSERVFEIIDTTSEVDDAPEAKSAMDMKGHVQFEHVNFGYRPGTLVIKDMTLDAKAGEIFALVGPTGAGKTTIINLLTRFYEINGGSISIDGVDIRYIKKDDLRLQLGLVLQDTFMFSATVMDNIRYGRLDATDEECIQAAKLADADHFTHQLPQGYQTNLSERASNLSQGQRQLLSIARAILADPAILILDEATSSVDTRTEARIQEALLRLMKGRTSFVIAHRLRVCKRISSLASVIARRDHFPTKQSPLDKVGDCFGKNALAMTDTALVREVNNLRTLSAIRDADQVLVINDGEIVEKGTHQQLLDKKGFYHHLYVSQFKGQAI